MGLKSNDAGLPAIFQLGNYVCELIVDRYGIDVPKAKGRVLSLRHLFLGSSFCCWLCILL